MGTLQTSQGSLRMIRICLVKSINVPLIAIHPTPKKSQLNFFQIFLLYLTKRVGPVNQKVDINRHS